MPAGGFDLITLTFLPKFYLWIFVEQLSYTSEKQLLYENLTTPSSFKHFNCCSILV
jgi:hypothetical protein